MWTGSFLTPEQLRFQSWRKGSGNHGNARVNKQKLVSEYSVVVKE